MSTLKKSIGFVAYPKLGHPAPYSSVMEVPKTQVPDRYKIAGQTAAQPAQGAVLYNQNKNPEKGLNPTRHKFSGFIDTGAKSALHANQGHEAQHSIFTKIKQQHGQEFANKLVDHTLSVLSPFEQKIMSYVNVDHKRYPKTMQKEELISHFHNYLQDSDYRDQVHKKLNLSPFGAKNLHSKAKAAWKKIRSHAETLDFPTVQKSEAYFDTEVELFKREPPKFPKLGVPDARKEVETISNPDRLYPKLRVMAHQGARKQYENGVHVVANNTGQVTQVPVHPHTVSIHQRGAKQEAQNTYNAARDSKTATMGQQAGSHGYALSGILRPAKWGEMGPDNENYSHGTKQHEEFHAQMSRISKQFGPVARMALADNLWNALPDAHRHAIDYLQNKFAGDEYEKRNPSTATEEKLARIFNYLNSPDTRNEFHGSLHQYQSQYVNEQGQVIDRPEGHYYVNGLKRLVPKQEFDGIIKDAHRKLLAAGEVANENWLRHGHTNSDYLRLPPEQNPNVLKSESVQSEAIDQMHGYSHSKELLCQAARFLSGKPTIDQELKRNLGLHNGNLKFAVLSAHGLEPNEKNIKALLSISKMQNLNKNFIDTKYEVRAAHPEAEQVVEEMQKAIGLGHVQPIKLGGKHSAGSLLVTLDNNDNWLLKPESNKKSPAAGISEEPATQSEREAAYYHIASVLGLGHIIPKTELVWLKVDDVEKQAAAIKMLPFSWRNLADLAEKDPNVNRTALEPYRSSGDLFKWAILDYILSNTDRHGSNLMASSKDDGYKLALIDHGSAFAGTGFSPGTDKDTWTPYYLRVWAHNNKWTELSLQEKLKALPRAPAEKEQEVFHWLLGINPDRIAAVMQRYGINAQPHIALLEKLKQCKEPIDIHIGKLWIGI